LLNPTLCRKRGSEGDKSQQQGTKQEHSPKGCPISEARVGGGETMVSESVKNILRGGHYLSKKDRQRIMGTKWVMYAHRKKIGVRLEKKASLWECRRKKKRQSTFPRRKKRFGGRVNMTPKGGKTFRCGEGKTVGESRRRATEESCSFKQLEGGRITKPEIRLERTRGDRGGNR